jgi:hypothetical protein
MPAASAIPAMACKTIRLFIDLLPIAAVSDGRPVMLF